MKAHLFYIALVAVPFVLSAIHVIRQAISKHYRIKHAVSDIPVQGASGVSDEWFAELDERRARITRDVLCNQERFE